jgi:predicted nucleotidyltransferase
MTARATWSAVDGRAVWSGRKLSDWVPDLVAEVVALVEPRAVWLYGSVARGDDGPDSDVDLLVVLDEVDPGAVIGLKQRLYECVTAPVPFDVSFTDPSNMRMRSGISGTLERAATSEGRLVHGGL